jgi:lipopolysaccharide export system protein LptA
MRRLRLFMTIQFLLLALCSGVAAQQGGGGKPADRGPIHVRSDRLEAEQQMNRVTFSGNVVAEQGDVTIYADELTLNYRSDSREIEQLEALGDVRIVQGDRVATSEKAVYQSSEGRIVLTGSPKVHQGQSFIEGDEIVFLLDEEKSLVKSKEGRVNAVFQPQGTE